MKARNSCWLFLLTIMMIPLMASSCDRENDKHEYITIVNKSDKDIYVSLSTAKIETPSDTLLYCGNIKTIIAPNSKFDFGYAATETWDDFFSARSYIQFMVFSEPYNLDGCTEEYLKDFTEKYQLKRYQLTKEDLDRMNWTITYP